MPQIRVQLRAATNTKGLAVGFAFYNTASATEQQVGDIVPISDARVADEFLLPSVDFELKHNPDGASNEAIKIDSDFRYQGETGALFRNDGGYAVNANDLSYRNTLKPYAMFEARDTLEYFLPLRCDLKYIEMESLGFINLEEEAFVIGISAPMGNAQDIKTSIQTEIGRLQDYKNPVQSTAQINSVSNGHAPIFIICIKYGPGFRIKSLSGSEQRIEMMENIGPLIGQVQNLSLLGEVRPYFQSGYLKLRNKQHHNFQTANQFVYFRFRNPYNGSYIGAHNTFHSNGYMENSMWDHAAQAAIYQLVSEADGADIWIKDIGADDTLGNVNQQGTRLYTSDPGGGTKLKSIDDFFNHYKLIDGQDDNASMMFVGPYLQQVDTISLMESSTNTHKVLGPGESITIPVLILYKLSDAGVNTTSIGYDIGFDIRNSLYSDPLFYNIQFNARYSQSVSDATNALTHRSEYNIAVK